MSISMIDEHMIPAREIVADIENQATAPTNDAREADGTIQEDAMVQKIRELPKDVGIMLVAVGACGFVLPGVMGSPAIVAGGLVLWPKAFGHVESWFGRRFPKVHREGLRQIGRYLDDLERRYSFSEENRKADSPAGSPDSRSEFP